jgi:hypothetical protein
MEWPGAITSRQSEPSALRSSNPFEEETIMHPRLYRLLETHSRIDRALRDEQLRRVPDPVRTTQLKKLKLRVKDLMQRFARKQVTA